MPERILSVSYDPSLLATRAMVLEQGQFAVTSVPSYVEALRRCKEGGFDLLILGHSVPAAEKLQLIESFRKHCAAPVLSLKRSGQGSLAEADFEAFSEDPRDLLRTVANIFTKRASA